MICAYLNPVMFFHRHPEQSSSEVSRLLNKLAQNSTRPRYAFMVLSLIAEVARPDGEAGPIVHLHGQAMVLRDYLCDGLSPMGARDPRRIAMIDRVRSELRHDDRLPFDQKAADIVIEEEVRSRIRKSGKSNLSRAVSELVGAGLLRRYYKGYAVDHVNRGAQRHVVYVLAGEARCLIVRNHDERPNNAAQPSLPGLFAAA